MKSQIIATRLFIKRNNVTPHCRPLVTGIHPPVKATRIPPKGPVIMLTHWGRVTYICVGNLTIIGSDNGLSPGRRQAIICTNPGIYVNWTLRQNNRNANILIQENALENVVSEMASILSRPQCVKAHTRSRYAWQRQGNQRRWGLRTNRDREVCRVIIWNCRHLAKYFVKSKIQTAWFSV